MDKESINKVLRVGNQIEELAKVAVFLEELGEEWEFSIPLTLSLNLVLEEALTNIISYGLDKNNKHSIEIQFEKSGNVLSITIIDDGKEYDPTLKADPDVTLPLEERPIGGLGIFLIKKIMDTIHYKRKDNRNYLILTKNI